MPINKIKVNDKNGGHNEIDNKNLKQNKTNTLKAEFFTFNTKLVLTQMKQVFTETLMLYHFLPKSSIRIETYLSGY